MEKKLLSGWMSFLILTLTGCGNEKEDFRNKGRTVSEQSMDASKKDKSLNANQAFDWRETYEQIRNGTFDYGNSEIMNGEWSQDWNNQWNPNPSTPARQPQNPAQPTPVEPAPVETPVNPTVPTPVDEEQVNSGQKIKMPVRVFSTGGPIDVERTVELNSQSQVDRIARIQLTLHRPAYRFSSAAIEGSAHEGKVSIAAKAAFSINQGQRIQLIEKETTGRLQIDGKTEQYGGLGGALHTNIVSIDVRGDLRPGVNTLGFHFLGHRKETIGYRVLDIQFLDSRGVRVVDPNSYLTTENPNTSPGFNGDIGDPVKGERFWNGETQNNRGEWIPFRMNLYPGSAKTMVASCAGCHADSGADLQYFAYSNESIYKRAQFHGFTEQQGFDIAAFIRSLPVPMHGRPWNPPYQPGRGLDEDSEKWAAGAGLNAVLEKDSDMLEEPQLFGSIDGEPDQDEVNRAFNVRGTLNVRNLRIAAQLPDWNAWLPELHPADHFSRNDYNWNRSSPQVQLDNMIKNRGHRDFIGTPAAALQKIPRLREIMGSLHTKTRRFLGQTCNGRPNCNVRSVENSGSSWRIISSPEVNSRFNTQNELPNGQPITIYDAKRDLAKWQAVKQFQINEFSKLTRLVNPESSAYPANSPVVYPLAQGERLGWVGDGQGPWPIASHITGIENLVHNYQNIRVARYESSLWYQLQMILNPGFKERADNMPIDWPYHMNHILHLYNDNENRRVQPKAGFRFFNQSLADRYDYAEPMRYYTSLLKMQQQKTIPLQRSYSLGRYGWSMRLISPWRIFSHQNGEKFVMQALDRVYDSRRLRGQISSALIRGFLDTSNRYEKTGGRGWDNIRCQDNAQTSSPRYWGCIQTRDYTPSETSQRSVRLFEISANRIGPNPRFADVLYRLIPALRGEFGWGPGHPTLTDLADFSEELWPSTNWQQRRSCSYDFSRNRTTCN